MNRACSGCLCEELWLLPRAANTVQNNVSDGSVAESSNRRKPRVPTLGHTLFTVLPYLACLLEKAPSAIWQCLTDDIRRTGRSAPVLPRRPPPDDLLACLGRASLGSPFPTHGLRLTTSRSWVF